MGYYTWYEMEIENKVDKNTLKDIYEYMKKEIVENQSFYPFENTITYSCEKEYFYKYINAEYECKWYDHQEEMIKLSNEFPDIVFYLHGEGEDNGDLWNKYYKNGKYQECYAEIIYPVYDESKLK